MFQYNPGDKLGPNYILFLKRLPKENLRADYKGEFQCPKCKKTFISRISSVATGNTKSCGCLKKEIMSKIGKENKGHSPSNTQFKIGDSIGPLKLTLIKVVSVSKGGVRKGYFLCPFCKKKFISNIYNIKRGHTISCGCIKSKGEQLIAQILYENNISFKKEKTYENCVSINNIPLRFDFYLPDFNILIEYDGEQHFYYRKSGYFTKDNFKNIQSRDEIKNAYCVNNSIKLIRVPYTDFDIITWNYIKEKIYD